MKLLESRAIRAAAAWWASSLTLIFLSLAVTRFGIPEPIVAETKAQLAQLQYHSLIALLAAILKWGAEDVAKYIPATPPAPPALPPAVGAVVLNPPVTETK